MATNTNMTLRPNSLGNTNQNWIGKSQYSDPFLNAAVDDFQIYRRPLSADEVVTLVGGQARAGDVASYKFDEESGAAAVVDSSGNGYPTDYITPTMYRQMIEWQAWNMDVNGDNRFPDNNEYFFNWNPTTKTLGRSGIHHNTLGSFNWMMYQDVAGLQARSDNQIELWPIDMGYDHFAVNNVSYHGSNLSIVWQKYFDGTNWVDVPGQLRSPDPAAANYNEVYFRPVTAQRVRVLMTRQPRYAVGVKEIQVFNTNPLGTGFWRHDNGQAIINSGNASSAGVCDAATWLRQYNPFQDLSASANCAQVATYVGSVVDNANCSGPSCAAMLKAQMLAAALDVVFDDPALASAKVDLTTVCADAACTTTEDDSAAFGGAASLTVGQILDYAAGQSNAGGMSWYGTKAKQVAAKDVVEAIGNLAVSA